MNEHGNVGADGRATGKMTVHDRAAEIENLCRKVPSRISGFPGLELVAANAYVNVTLEIAAYWPNLSLLQDRAELACHFESSSPISSRKIVPPLAGLKEKPGFSFLWLR